MAKATGRPAECSALLQQNEHWRFKANTAALFRVLLNRCLNIFAGWKWELTDAHMSFQDHADIIGTVSDGQSDGMLLWRLYQLNDL